MLNPFFNISKHVFQYFLKENYFVTPEQISELLSVVTWVDLLKAFDLYVNDFYEFMEKMEKHDKTATNSYFSKIGRKYSFLKDMGISDHDIELKLLQLNVKFL